jgi:hypothetical protein
LSENLFKIATACFINITREEIESNMNDLQFAYKKGNSGTGKACEKLYSICKKRIKSMIVKCDFSSAFDKLSRFGMFKVLFDKLENYSFLHMYKRTISALELNLNLGNWLRIPGIRSIKGSPQGDLLSV